MRLQHVVSGVRSIPSAIIYHACIDDRTGLPVMSIPSWNLHAATFHAFPSFLIHRSEFHTVCCTYRHVTAPLDHPRAPNSGDCHFKSVTRISPPVRVVLPLCPDNTRLGRAFREPSPGEKWVTGVSESPESGESGRGAGVEFHSVAGESCCAGVQVFYFTWALIYVHPPTWPCLVNQRLFWEGHVCKIKFHSMLCFIQLVKLSYSNSLIFLKLNITAPKDDPLGDFDYA